MSTFVRQVERLPKPVASRLASLDVELTERCNNDCIHCCINLPATDAQVTEREMTTCQVKKVLAEAADLGCLQVRFTGGEPLLRPDFEELYLHARRLGMKVLLFTNGRLLTPRLADVFARIPPRVPIEITVYGMRVESYQAVTRTPGSFAEFRRGVSLLLEREVPFVVKSAYLPPNKNEVDEFEAWARTIPWMTGRPRYSLFLELRRRRDDATRDRVIKSLRVSPREGLSMLTREAGKYRKEMGEFASRSMPPADDVLFACGAGRGICVDAYGSAHPCLGVRNPGLSVELFSAAGPDAAAGRSTSGLSDVLDRFASLRDLRATNPEYLRRCAVCFLKGFCDQCPAKSCAENGTLDTPVAYLCEVAHAQARYLGWLGPNEHGWQVASRKDRME